MAHASLKANSAPPSRRTLPRPIRLFPCVKRDARRENTKHEKVTEGVNLYTSHLRLMANTPNSQVEALHLST